MATGLKSAGEELFIKQIFREDLVTLPNTLELHLFDDNTDAIGDSGDFACITTQPASTGSATYAPQSSSFGTGSIVPSLNSSSNWEIDIADLSFDVSSLASSATVRDYAATASVQLSGDGSPTRHLLWTGDLDQSYDLGQHDTFTLQDTGVIFD